MTEGMIAPVPEPTPDTSADDAAALSAAIDALPEAERKAVLDGIALLSKQQLAQATERVGIKAVLQDAETRQQVGDTWAAFVMEARGDPKYGRGPGRYGRVSAAFKAQYGWDVPTDGEIRAGPFARPAAKSTGAKPTRDTTRVDDALARAGAPGAGKRAGGQ